MSFLYESVASVEIGTPMMRIFGCAAFFAGLAIPMTSMLQAIGHQVAALRNIAIGALLKIIVNFIFVGIPSVNIQGAAAGTFACYLFVFAANLITLIKATGIKPSFKKVLLKPFLSAAACGVTAYFVSTIGTSKLITLASICAAAVVYFTVIFALGGVTESELALFFKKRKIISFMKNINLLKK